MPEQKPLPIVWHKRAFDLVVGSVLLLLCLPLFVLFVLLIFFEHLLRGRPSDPLFYREARVSRGAIFQLCKFNIFDQGVIDDLKSGGVFIHTKELEKRGELIFVGKALKQIYLDELPQLFNVLRGEMSLVGPRPLNLEVYAQLCEERVPTLALIQGGLTGNFQSYKNTRGATASLLESKYLEIYRRGGWRLILEDIRIMLRTLKVLLRAKGV